MGCDIHIFIERRNKEKQKWEKVSLYYKDREGNFNESPIFPGRSYELFSLLAGVRGSLDPIKDLQGLPDDLSKEVQEEYNKMEDWSHSATYYFLSEMQTCYAIDYYPIFKNFVDSICDYINFSEYFIWDTYRIVMWFDN